MENISFRVWQRLACLFLLLAGLQAQAFSLLPDGAGKLTLTYTPKEWPAALEGDLYLPDAKAKGPFPVVLLLHGGAWRQGDKGKLSKLGRVLAERGYAAFAIDYRLAPQFRYPAQLEDMRQALRWLQQQAGEYNLDMNRVAAWGYSAGGHLASLLGVQPPSEGLPSVRVVIAGGAPADLRIYPNASSVKGFLGGTAAELPAVYESASPMAHVRKGLPAFYLYHGTADDLVVPSQSQNFARALSEAGVHVELRLLDGQNHRSAASAAKRLLPEALGFLERHIAVRSGGSSGVQRSSGK